MSVTVATSFDDAKARAIGWLTAWDSRGIHRTATAGDEAGALWLADEAAGLGAAVTSEAFPLVGLELGDRRILGVPPFDAPATGDDGVTGRLTLDGGEQGILVAELRPQSVYTGQYDRLQRGAAHRAWSSSAPARAQAWGC